MCRNALRLLPRHRAIQRAHVFWPAGNSVVVPLRPVVPQSTRCRSSGRWPPFGGAIGTIGATVCQISLPESSTIALLIHSVRFTWCQQEAGYRSRPAHHDIPSAASRFLDGIGSTEVGQTFVSNSVDEWRPGTLERSLRPMRFVLWRQMAPQPSLGSRGTRVRGPGITRAIGI